MYGASRSVMMAGLSSIDVAQPVGGVAVHWGEQGEAVRPRGVQRGEQPLEARRAALLPGPELLRGQQVGQVPQAAVIGGDGADIQAVLVEHHQTVDVAVDGGGAQVDVDGVLGAEGCGGRPGGAGGLAQGASHPAGVAAVGLEGQHLGQAVVQPGGDGAGVELVDLGDLFRDDPLHGLVEVQAAPQPHRHHAQHRAQDDFGAYAPIVPLFHGPTPSSALFRYKAGRILSVFFQEPPNKPPRTHLLRIFLSIPYFFTRRNPAL